MFTKPYGGGLRHQGATPTDYVATATVRHRSKACYGAASKYDIARKNGRLELTRARLCSLSTFANDTGAGYAVYIRCRHQR